MTILLITSLDFWLLCLALCLGLWGFVWSLNVARKRKRENGTITPIITMSEKLKQKGQTMLANTAKVGLGTVLGVLLGTGIREHQLLKGQLTYTDVSVLTKFAARDFLVWPDRMRKERMQLCPESSVDWHEGEMLDDLTFEQKQDCKRIISYHEKPQGELDASIQMR